MNTKVQKVFLVVVALAIAAECRYYPMEVEDGDDGSMELVELVPLRRFPRGLQGAPQPPPQMRYQEPEPQQRPHKRYPSHNHHNHQHERRGPPPVFMQDQFEPLEVSGSKRDPLVASETGHGGGGHGHDYVDYGAYTGGYGAFGWYSDHPVHTYGH